MLTTPASAQVIVPDTAFLVREFIPTDLASSLEAQITKEITGKMVTQKKFGKGRPFWDTHHRMGRFGDPEVTYTYRDKPKPVHPWTPGLARIAVRVAQELQWIPNCVVVNTYAEGTGLYPHRDSRYIPQLGENPVIASVSFGQARQFLLHPLNEKDKRLTEGVVSTSLSHGDLFVMYGECDAKFHHSIPDEPEAVGLRLSLTFRRHLL